MIKHACGNHVASLLIGCNCTCAHYVAVMSYKQYTLYITVHAQIYGIVYSYSIFTPDLCCSVFFSFYLVIGMSESKNFAYKMLAHS